MTQEKHTPEQQPRRSSKPVLIYIMILFIAAFLLMALSFAMHQRSNQQAMGELETSFMTTIKDMQADQDKLLILQDKLSDTENQLQDTQKQLSAAETALTESEALFAAQQQLYCLQQEYASGDYAGCKIIIDKMEASGAVNLLSSTPLSTDSGSVTAPFVRFQQLKSAVLEKLAAAEAETAE